MTDATDARIVADATARVLLLAVQEGSLAAGTASDLAEQIADDVASAGVSLDDLLGLTARTSPMREGGDDVTRAPPRKRNRRPGEGVRSETT